MAALKIGAFGGTAPRLSRRALPQQLATKAKNCKLASTELRPFHQALSVYTSGKTGPLKSIYRFGIDTVSDTNYWFTFPTDTDVVRAPIADDQTERTVWADGVQCKVTNNTVALQGGGSQYPNNAYILGVPTPANQVSLAISGTASGGTPATSRAYVVTYVSAFGEEGPPCASNSIEWNAGQSVIISGLPTAPTGNYNIQSVRIYRTVTATTGTAAFQFVAEVAIGTASYTDTIADTALGAEIPSIDYQMPPNDIRGLVAHPCGSMIGFKGKDIYISAPFQPHAWPIHYRLTVEYTIVGFGVFGQSVVVCTTGNPYILTGTDPAAMSLVKLALPYACAAKRSIAYFENGVIYASPDGLILVDATGAHVLTEQTHTRDEWQALNPASITAAIWNRVYYGFYNNGTAAGFIFDPVSQIAHMVDLDQGADAVFVDKQIDALFICNGNVISKWDAGAAFQTYDWISKEFTLPRPGSMAYAQVYATAYPVTFKLIADGNVIFTKTVNDDNTFVLPAGYVTQFWQLELTGSNPVTQVAVAESITELKSV